MSATEILAQVRELPLEQRREIAEALWNELEQEESSEFIAELERRAEEMRQHPERGIPWETVQAELQERLKSRKA